MKRAAANTIYRGEYWMELAVVMDRTARCEHKASVHVMVGWIALLAVVSIHTGCKALAVNSPLDRIVPRNDRNWTKDMVHLTTADFLPDGRVAIRNIRNCEYLTETDYVVDYYDRTIRLEDVQSVDFIMVPFKNMPAVAHTMLSFGLADGSYLCVSAEIRKEIGEDYSPMLGISNQFELIYLVADERDLIRLRTRHRDVDVYIYPTIAQPRDAQALFTDVFQRVNQLANRPEFYHTFTNNCTTNLVSHVNRLHRNKVPFGWKVLLPGFSDRYAYELGLLDNRLPFDELKALAHVNGSVDRFFDHPRFSVAIRDPHRQIEQAIELNVRRNQDSVTR
ncbi:MAG TPA: DUF4105 domain-containing protein [Pirellulaceae bacterium]|nr:DUF4105 domain-containing protein [Pirellulaceae bacterium]